MYPAVKITKRPKYRCPCPNKLDANSPECLQNLCNGTEKNANHFSGNTNMPGFAVTNAFIKSTAIQTSSYRNGGSVPMFANTNYASNFLSTVNSNSSCGQWAAAAPKLNDFGRWEGAPGGSGRPPTNRFQGNAFFSLLCV